MKQFVLFRATFLGTGTSVGVPMIGCQCPTCLSDNPKDKRLRSSVLIESASTTIIIDAGPDVRAQLLRSNTRHIDAVLVTHLHKDHIGGMDDLRALCIINNTKISVYATAATQQGIKREIPYAFEEPIYPTASKIDLHTIEKNTPFTIGDLTITPIHVWHGPLPIVGFRIGSFTYITDCNRIDDEEKKKITLSEHFAINGIRWEKHSTHFSIDEAMLLAKEIQAKNTYITHISHQLGKHKEISEQLPNNIFLAHDMLTINCRV